MGFYDLDKEQRDELVKEIHKRIAADVLANKDDNLLKYFSDADTYVRKSAYQAVGKIYDTNNGLRSLILRLLENTLINDDPKVRQTTINAAGEIGKKDFDAVQHFFDTGLFDKHHSVRNAVIGSMKKMGEKNPAPVIAWSRRYLHHTDKEIRREICHGIELRGRTHPEDILPLLRELQFDKTKRVRGTLVHVIGQISYKNGCLEKVMADIITWEDKELVLAAIDEIVDVHHRYRNFSHYTQEQAIAYVAPYRQLLSPQ